MEGKGGGGDHHQALLEAPAEGKLSVLLSLSLSLCVVRATGTKPQPFAICRAWDRD